MHIHFVINPVAGRRRTTALIEAAMPMLREHGIEVSRYVTTCAGDAGAHVAALAKGACDRLVVVGGDGTLREVVNGRPPPLPWPVGLVPVGTANLAGRELGMPRELTPRAVAEALRTAKPWPVDLLRLDRPGQPSTYAVSNVGVGLDAEIVHTISRIRRGTTNSGGYLRWIRPIWRACRGFGFKSLSVTIDGRRTYRASSVIVQNAHNYGGVFELAREARLDSGQAHVMLLRCRSTRDLLRVLFGASRGRADRYHDVRFDTGTEVRLHAGPGTRVQADGDPAGETDLSITLLPGALRLLRVGHGAPDVPDTPAAHVGAANAEPGAGPA